jgi:hypothetical protein
MIPANGKKNQIPYIKKRISPGRTLSVIMPTPANSQARRETATYGIHLAAERLPRQFFDTTQRRTPAETCISH